MTSIMTLDDFHNGEIPAGEVKEAAAPVAHGKQKMLRIAWPCSPDGRAHGQRPKAIPSAAQKGETGGAGLYVETRVVKREFFALLLDGGRLRPANLQSPPAINPGYSAG